MWMPSATADELSTRFREERDRLERLAERHPYLPTRSPVLDPSAWFLLQELDQFKLVPDAATSPLGPLPGDSLDVLFDAADERVGAALLPEVASRIEKTATVRWQELLGAARRDAELAAAMAGLAEEWFDPVLAAEPPAPGAAPVRGRRRPGRPSCRGPSPG